jgi:hypothetical protein
MVIMIAPTKTEQILSPLLQPSGCIPRFPILALFREEKLGCNLRSNSSDGALLAFGRMVCAMLIESKIAFPHSPDFPDFLDSRNQVGRDRLLHKMAPS